MKLIGVGRGSSPPTPEGHAGLEERCPLGSVGGRGSGGADVVTGGVMVSDPGDLVASRAMYAVILAGGGGTRLWPLSRVARPKPFLALTGGSSLLASTVARLDPLISASDVFIVGDARYRELIGAQLAATVADHFIEEPVGRNTAAAVALAAVRIDRPGDEIMAVLPADHRIRDEEGFRTALATAADIAADGSLVTLGIRPTGPQTGYGYVVAARSGDDSERSLPVERFFEKPTHERAQELLGGGRALWNAGIFVWRRDAALEGLRRHAPDILDQVTQALSAGDKAVTYGSIRSTSIDYALLEPASGEGRVRVIPIDVGWSDLGSWAALEEALREDGDSVVAVMADGSEHLDLDSHDILVHATGGRLLVTVGLRDLIVVDTPDAILICDRENAQAVKQVVERLAAEGQTDRL